MDCFFNESTNQGQFYGMVDNTTNVLTNMSQIIGAASAAYQAANEVKTNMAKIGKIIKAQAYNESLRTISGMLGIMVPMINCVLRNREQLIKVDEMSNQAEYEHYANDDYIGYSIDLTYAAGESTLQIADLGYEPDTVPYAIVKNMEMSIPNFDEAPEEYGVLECQIEIKAQRVLVLGWIERLFNVLEDKNIEYVSCEGGQRRVADLRKVWGFKTIQNGIKSEFNDRWLSQDLGIVLPLWMSNTQIVI